MSQTVTIPSCMNPFEVTINNHTYSFKSGESVELPDEVAEVINHHVDSVPKPLEKEEEVTGGGSSIDIQPLNVTENGTYTAPEGTAYSPVEVNVASSGGGENKLAKLVDKSITEITAADLEGATQIGDYAFYKCPKLKNVDISDSVTSIGPYAFYEHKGKTININGGVVNIGQRAFYNPIAQQIIISDKVEKIDGFAFWNCTLATKIIIGKSVKSIGASAFEYAGVYASNLRIIIKAETPPTIQSNTFSDILSSAIFEVPAASVEAYKAATNWSAKASQIVASEEF